MAKNKKTPKKAVPVQQVPARGKHAVPSVPIDTIDRPDEKLSWRVGMIDLAGPWGWVALAQAGDPVSVLKKLRNFESMTWGEIIGKGNKRIPVGHLSSDAQRRLRTKKLDDLDDLWELRLSGQQRIWGARFGACFHPLWWDPEHTVCPSSLRHT